MAATTKKSNTKKAPAKKTASKKAPAMKKKAPALKKATSKKKASDDAAAKATPRTLLHPHPDYPYSYSKKAKDGAYCVVFGEIEYLVEDKTTHLEVREALEKYAQNVIESVEVEDNGELEKELTELRAKYKKARVLIKKLKAGA